MRKHFEDVKYIYTFVFVITVTISILAVIWPGMVSQENTKYYFFLANRHKDTHRYTGENLEIQAASEGHQERPPYIFKNRLLFLYYWYMVRLRNEFSPQYKISFDIYPELFFLKLYPLEGKVIAFNIDLLCSHKGIYALEYELDLSDQNRFLSRFIFICYDGDT
ncbi:MAG: hypothetical protein PHQ54_04225, partial [Candidatus Omnitrophica bacterium]|nr:hypothetical protein [Candidatus Omnitrophota bacterium]